MKFTFAAEDDEDTDGYPFRSKPLVGFDDDGDDDLMKGEIQIFLY